MALPTLSASKYTLKLPSSGKSISYRPFLVKEEKILLVAQESDDPKQILQAILELISACTFGSVDPLKLTMYDLEYLFLKIRSKSVGETASIQVACPSCGAYHPMNLNLDEIEVTTQDPKMAIITLTDTGIGVKMRHIQVGDMEKLTADGKSEVETLSDLIIASIESIFDSSSVYPASETPRSELEDFINSMNRDQMSKIEAFIASTPKLSKSIEFSCKACGHDAAVILSGMKSFFA